MRIIRHPDELEQGLKSARSEAKGAFGDDRIFIEKYLEEPRHIEIQILADSYGNVVHLFERECSVQRRYQKVIEEAPSPLVDEELRKSMAETAILIAKLRSEEHTSELQSRGHHVCRLLLEKTK